MLKKSINLLLGLSLMIAPAMVSCTQDKPNGPEQPGGEPTPLEESTIVLGAEAGAKASVTYNFESSWQVNNGLSWVKVSPLSGFSGENTINIEAKEANTSLEERVGYFSLAVNGGLIKNWIVQEGPQGIAPVLSVVGLGSEAGDKTFEVNANVKYNVTTDASWITVKGVEYPDSVLLADNATRSKYMTSVVTINVAENTGDLRDAVINLVSEDGQIEATVTVQQMGEMVADFSQDFYRRSIAMRFTATWCGYCPTMAESIEVAMDGLPGRIIPFTLHATSSEGGLAYNGTNNFSSLYQIGGYPTGIMNGYADISNYPVATASKMFMDVATEAITLQPSKSNIGGFVSVSSSNVDVNLTVATKEAGTYKISVFLLEDGIVYNQNSGGSDYVHNYVVRKELTGIYGDEFTGEANGHKDFHYNIAIPSSIKNAANLHVVAYISYADGFKKGSVGSVDYKDFGSIIDQVIDIKGNDICVFKYE